MARATTPVVRRRAPAAVAARAARMLAAGALAGALVMATTGCSASPVIAPSGVDELVVPVLAPDPDAYVAVVDNPWLALPADPGPVIAGVSTTEVRTGAGVDYYAQDDRGNVWWFGREGVWSVAQDGAEAGLVITATPRLGDGYQSALYRPRPPVPTSAGVDVVSEVVDVDAEITVGGTTYEQCVVIDARDLVTGSVTRSWFVRDIGQVQTEQL